MEHFNALVWQMYVALSLYPSPWTVEGKDVSKVSRRTVPAVSHWRMQQDVARQLQ